ncbi:FAD-dependent oxidoreductase [Cohnella abietis]|uniref:Oxidoreductase n=1 Tax=Cohnella abietis TaxID=2507935 RepID=A0A3T1D5G9_9BACL|nr:FAD-binding protein [Cohnella abietis]BBI33350.1 oxidoreductase [Cohnella abietis]
MKNEAFMLDADVLVLGGGPAGTWAAYTAATMGARVILADKGYCGSSGATAPAGTTLLGTFNDSIRREQEINACLEKGDGLADRSWIEKLHDNNDAGTAKLVELGYPFPKDQNGLPIRRSLQGPEYMRLMRKSISKIGVKILDRSPALKLLTENEAVTGAMGVNTQTGKEWTVHAGAVIIATGGCAFLSRALGCNVLTGDGNLMAAEVGAELSGMEYSNEYGMAAGFSSVTKNYLFNWAKYYRSDDSEIENPNKRILARVMMNEPVRARLENGADQIESEMRRTQPNFFVPFDRQGINPFKDKFPIALRLEATVRGTGGINLTDQSCATSVKGLFAAGDAATRELVSGGTTGGGRINASWAIASGCLSGEGAARYALSHRKGVRTGFKLRNAHSAAKFLGHDGTKEVIRLVQNEVTPFSKNLFRTGDGLTNSLRTLDELWNHTGNGLISHEDVREVVRARETAAMVATARMMYASALERKESRGMHIRDDYPEQDPTMQYRLILKGVHQFSFRPQH